jgi:hypothetical protein
MKKQIYKLLALLIIILISSCESYQIHGNLDGFWQVTSIENKQTGEITHCKGDTYYSFQRELVLISYVSPNIPTGQMKENYVAYFSHKNDSISMTDFRRIYVDKDEPVTLSKLEKFGLYDTFNNFQVEKLDKNNLVLNSNRAIITLQKY